MQTTKFSTFDRLVNLQQLAETNTIKRINKRLLQEQIISNLELDRLNQQLSQANVINGQILENQIKELKQREKQKYFKDISFKIRALVTAIKQIPDTLVKCYFINKYYEILKGTASTAEENLEEISDRMFNSTTIEEIDVIKQTSNIYSEEYQLSPLSKIDESINELNDLKRRSLGQLPNQSFANIKVKPKINPFRIFGLIILGLLTLLFFIAFIGTFLATEKTNLTIATRTISTIFFLGPLAIFLLILRKDAKWRKDYPEYIKKHNQLLNAEMDKQAGIKDGFDSAIFNHPSHAIYQKILESFPNFENTANTINDLFDRCFPISNALAKTPNKPLLKKAADLVVMNQKCSDSFLQRKLAIGKGQVNKIIDQLEMLEIIEMTGDGKSYQVLVSDQHSLSEKLNALQ